MRSVDVVRANGKKACVSSGVHIVVLVAAVAIENGAGVIEHRVFDDVLVASKERAIDECAVREDQLVRESPGVAGVRREALDDAKLAGAGGLAEVKIIGEPSIDAEHLVGAASTGVARGRVSDIVNEDEVAEVARFTKAQPFGTPVQQVFVDPKSVALRASSVVADDDVVRVFDPEARCVIGIGGNWQPGFGFLGAEYEVVEDLVVVFGPVFEEDTVANMVVDDVVFNTGVGRAVNGDALLEAVVDRGAFNILTLDLATEVPMSWVAAKQVALASSEVLDALYVLCAAGMHHRVRPETVVHTVRVSLDGDVAVEQRNLSANLDIPLTAIGTGLAIVIADSFATMAEFEGRVESDRVARDRPDRELFGLLPVGRC